MQIGLIWPEADVNLFILIKDALSLLLRHWLTHFTNVLEYFICFVYVVLNRIIKCLLVGNSRRPLGNSLMLHLSLRKCSIRAMVRLG